MDHTDTIAYKNWLENLDEPAPEGAWDAIADQLDIDATWNSISETLDLDTVWQNIETGLPQEPATVSNNTTHFPKIFWVAAVLALLTLTTPVADKNIRKQSDTTANSRIKSYPEPEAANRAPIQPHPSTQTGAGYTAKPQLDNDHEEMSNSKKNDRVASILLIDNVDVATVTVSETPESEKADSGEKDIQEQNFMADNIPHEMHGIDSVIKKLERDSIIMQVASAEEDSSVQNMPVTRARWQVGVIASVKNTWLINPETTNGLKRSSLNDTRLTFGKEFGVTLQRSVSKYAELQFEYYFYSEIGQRYHEYINALYQTKSIELHYQKAQVLYRVQVFRKVSSPALYALGGMRISRLTLADASIGGENDIVTQEYQPWDYGFIAGGEAEFPLGKKFLVVSGVRASYGIRNIYLGNTQNPSEFNKTHTASVGLSIGMKYKIK